MWAIPKGVTSFSEEEFHKANTFRHNPNPLFPRNLWINNQKVVAGDETGVLTKAFPYTQKLKLSHNQNNLILSFALPDYEQTIIPKTVPI